MSRDEIGPPPHHRRPATLGRSIGVIIGWGLVGVLVGIGLAVSVAGPWRPVALVVAVVVGTVYGMTESDRISDSHAWQADEAARRLRKAVR